MIRLFRKLLFTACFSSLAAMEQKSSEAVETYQLPEFLVTECGIPFYLAGTVHESPTLVRLGQNITNHIRQADAIYLELDKSVPQADQHIKESVSELLETKLKSDEVKKLVEKLTEKTLESELRLLSQDEQTRLAEQLKLATDFDLTMFLRRRPLTLFQFVEDSLVDEQELPEKDSVENSIVRMAKKERKFLGGLENFDPQIKALSENMDSGTQSMRTVLLALLKSLTQYNLSKNGPKLYVSVAKGNLSEISQMRYFMSAIESKQLYKHLLLDREENFARQLVEHAKTQKIFAAVGAMHLAGDDSLPARLHIDFGCKVERAEEQVRSF